jgi:CIC family chloride channel protein
MLAWIGFGVLLGVVSMIYIRALYGFEDMFERMPGNDYTCHALGMLLVGIMMYLLLRYTGHYAIQGVGYATIQDILQQLLLHPSFLLLLFALKLLATSLTLGSGASGGIFSPSLFMGATLGGAYAVLLAPPIPGAQLDIAGMAGMVVGATGAVVTAIVMIFEMTCDCNVIIRLMITASVAYGIRRALLRDSIYTMKLSRRGHSIPEALQTNLYLMHSAGELLDVPMLRRAADDCTPLRKVLHARRRTPHILLVGDAQIAGLISADELRRLDPDTRLSRLFATHGTSDFITVSADDTLFDVFIRLRDSRADTALVTAHGDTDSEKNVIGALTWEQIAHASHLPDALRHRRPAPKSR